MGVVNRLLLLVIYGMNISRLPRPNLLEWVLKLHSLCLQFLEELVVAMAKCYNRNKLALKYVPLRGLWIIPGRNQVLLQGRKPSQIHPKPVQRELQKGMTNSTIGEGLKIILCKHGIPTDLQRWHISFITILIVVVSSYWWACPLQAESLLQATSWWKAYMLWRLLQDVENTWRSWPDFLISKKYTLIIFMTRF